MRTAGILSAALIAAATITAPAAVQAQTSASSTTTSVTTTTIPLPYHNNGPVQYDASTATFTVNGAAMSKAQAAAYFQKEDPFYWNTLQPEFESTPAEFADHWDQLAFNLPAMVPPSDMAPVSADAPI